jgi:amino acid transporter
MRGEDETHPVALRRTLSLPLVFLYGLGTTVGAGIYALMGEVSLRAGMFSGMAFLVASLLAAASALSFAELCARFPRSAGEAEYVRQGFGTPRLSVVVGLLVVLSGSVSSAALANGCVGYFGVFVDAGRELTIAALVVGLGLLAAWGIRSSVLLAGAVTVLEVGGIAAVFWAARESLGGLPERWLELVPPADPKVWSGIFAASLLAFYAFLGFEDMVNVAEEVRNVRRSLPIAIILTLIVTTVLYICTALVSVLTVPPVELGRSGAPLVLVYEKATGGSGAAVGLIGVLAMLNGALIQVIMASRVLYGLADRGALPEVLARIHPRTQTPVIATALVTSGVCALAVWFPLAPLAEATSVITLVIFALVNLSLCMVKRREPHPPDVQVYPLWVPWAGFGVSLGFLFFEAIRHLPV